MVREVATCERIASIMLELLYCGNNLTAGRPFPVKPAAPSVAPEFIEVPSDDRMPLLDGLGRIAIAEAAAAGPTRPHLDSLGGHRPLFVRVYQSNPRRGQ